MTITIFKITDKENPVKIRLATLKFKQSLKFRELYAATTFQKSSIGTIVKIQK